MITVVGQIKRSFAFYSALLITLITRVKADDPCGLERLHRCEGTLASLNSGLTFASSKAELDRTCPDLKEAVKCIRQHTRSCMSLEHHRHFENLFHDTAHVVNELCGNSTYQREYLKHAPCMKTVTHENEVCVTRHMRNMRNLPEASTRYEVEPQAAVVQKKRREIADGVLKVVCCSFREFIQCSTRTMGRACGEEAAEFSKGFLDKMSHTMIKSYCSEYGQTECGLYSSAQRLSLSALLAAFLPLLASSFALS